MSEAVPAVLVLILALGSSFRAEAVDAVITDQKGTKTSVTGLRSHRADNCKGFTYYIGTPTETDTYSDSIFLSVDDDQYRIEIPLDIIKSATRGQSDTKDRSSRRSEQWTVVLSDDTTLTGKPTTFSDFKGKAELGDFTIPQMSVGSITFSSPKTTHQAKSNGSRTVTLHVSDTEKRSLGGATFIFENKNQNGCFTGFGYRSSVQFVTEGSAKYELSWDKIRELRFTKEKYSASLQLVAPSGTEYTGRVQEGLGIEGVSRIGAFDLHVIVPFASTAKRLTVDEK
jgi:hypothetical protein